MKEAMDKQVAYLEFANRENNFHHHRYSEELRQYEYIKNGDMRSVEEAEKMIHSAETGHLSDNPLKNLLYLCICSVTLVTRFAIEGGMNNEKAYNASDLYIRRLDRANSLEELFEIHRDMVEYFTKAVASAKKEHVYSRQVIWCMDYIFYHLNERITAREMASQLKINESYLSVLFKRETGVSISEYVIIKRMEAAENMIKFSDYTLSEISDMLHFSSYSHFARTFRKYYNTSPKVFRKENYGHSGIGEYESDLTNKLG